MTTHTVTLTLARETKGALLYKEAAMERGDPHYAIGTLYLRKAWLRGTRDTWPQRITVALTDSTSVDDVLGGSA